MMGRRFIMMIMIGYDICVNHNHHNKSASHHRKEMDAQSDIVEINKTESVLYRCFFRILHIK